MNEARLRWNGPLRSYRAECGECNAWWTETTLPKAKARAARHLRESPECGYEGVTILRGIGWLTLEDSDD